MRSPLFFFFQAEDGIRDTSVTGVQTCVFRSSCLSGPSSFTPLPDGRYLLMGPDKQLTQREVSKFSKKDAENLPDRKSVVQGKSKDPDGERLEWVKRGQLVGDRVVTQRHTSGH